MANLKTAAIFASILIVCLGQPSAANAAQPGILGVTVGGVNLTVPPTTPAGQEWRYGLGMPIQLDATTAGLLVNIRRNDTGYWDYEVGADLIKFNSLSGINAGNAVPISRAGYEPNPDTSAPSVTVKYPTMGGFVARGATFANGAAHPYGGTGFGLSMTAFFPADFPQPQPDPASYRLELTQLRYDGSTFTASQPVRSGYIPVGSTGWYIGSGGLSPAIPDGNDLLYAVTCGSSTGASAAGVARFQYNATTGWQPTSFVPVTDASFSAEPSLIRDTDGSLLLTARNSVGQVSGTGENVDIPLWRSTTGNAGTWNQSFLVTSVRRNTPLSIGQSVDGTPYIATNTLSTGTRRNSTQIIPIDSTRTDLELESAIVARDAAVSFGPTPSGQEWIVDHSMSNVVRLADGEWHDIFTYRVFDHAESFGSTASPYSGCYVEEVSSLGDPRPMGLTFVPEPSSLVLALFAAACVPWFIRRQRMSQQPRQN